MKKNLIAGTDEVGRGCLAGPVVAAAVILKNKVDNLDDSKKLSTQKRVVAYFFWLIIKIFKLS